MLPVEARLKHKADFQRILGLNQKQHYGALLIFQAPGEAVRSRFGLVVSKKVDPKAVGRNRIRRQLLALLRPISQLEQPPTDWVILVLYTAEHADYQTAISQWQKKSLSI